MPKKTPKRDVWVPKPVVVAIGETEYTVEPQPLRQYLVFEERLRELIGGWSPADEAEPTLSADRQAPSEEEGEEVGEEEEIQVEAEESPAKSLVGQGIEATYEVLNCMIPDLEIEDVYDAPEPQIEHVLEVCLKINGGRWAQTLISQFFTPLLPTLQALAVQWLTRGVGETTSTVIGEPAPIDS